MPVNDELQRLPELYLQRVIRRLFGVSGRRWEAVCGTPFQVLAVGEWNLEAGPDFLEMALLVDGQTITGAGEVHRKSSDWRMHNHHRDVRYADVLLHIVLQNDVTDTFAKYTCQLDRGDLLNALREDQAELQELRQKSGSGISAMDTIQEFAVKRLQRKSRQALDCMEQLGLEGAVFELCRSFLEKSSAKRRRPGGLKNRSDAVVEHLGDSHAMRFLHSLARGENNDPGDLLDSVIDAGIAGEGKGSSTELVVNVVLPIALVLSDRKQRTSILNWFWSIPAAQTYGSLKKKFSHLPQDTVWQQQGLLEYYFECRFGKERIGELLFPYSEQESEQEVTDRDGD